MVGPGYEVIVPLVVMRPIVALPKLLNQMAPSSPPVISSGAPTVASEKVVMAPAGVIRLMLLLSVLHDHRFPSGPTVMPSRTA